MSKSKFSKATTLLLLGVTLAPAVLGSLVNGHYGQKRAYAQEYRVTDGHVSTKPDGSGQNNGKIVLEGSKQDKSIKHKQFMFYKIFNITNSEFNESVNYTWNEKFKSVVQKVVFDKLSQEYKTANKINAATDVSEYAAIDYMQSLNNNRVEGALSTQKPEGRYSDFRYFVEDLKNAIRQANIEGDKYVVDSADAQNSMTVEGLSWGYYFVDEISTGDDVGNGQPATTSDGRPTDGTHYASSLVMVSTVNNTATLKLKSDYPSIIKKIQEDNWNDGREGHEQIGNDGWNDIGDYQIGQTIPYSNDVEIPDMNGYHGYYLAIEDRMAKELTFHADKSKIKLVIGKKGSDKTYNVKSDEYNLQTIGSNVSNDVKESKFADNFESSSTFALEFEDLKAIVDREFPEFGHTAETANETHKNYENDYEGLTLHLEYEGHLNDLAADKTGRPGFENDVRLVFSNDPDSTGSGHDDTSVKPGSGSKGHTPWDTVVAFTYRLNGNKVNTNNFALKGAKFRIYSDAAATKEIKVKKKNATNVVETKTQSNPNSLTGTQPVEGSKNGPDSTNKTTAKSETGTTIEPNAGRTNNLQADNDSPTKGSNEYVVVDNDISSSDTSDPIESDADGNFSIIGLDSDVYYIKEVEAPDGYRLLKDPIKVDIKSTFSDDRNSYIKGEGSTDKTLKSLAAKASMTEFYHQIFKTGDADLHTDAQSGVIESKIVNETNELLPAAGGQMLAVLATLGLGITSFTIYAVAARKMTKEDN